MQPTSLVFRHAWAVVCATALLGCLLLAPTSDRARSFAQTLDDAAAELEQNRKLLDRIRRNEPEHYQRLKHDLRQFLTLPPERQAQLRQVDREVHEESSTTTYRLLEALARYVDWLEHLTPAERQEIDRATNRDERLANIRKVREQEWVQRLPVALQDQIAKATNETRAAVVSKIHREERERRALWRVAIRHWDDAVVRGNPQPTRQDELPANVQQFVIQNLLPLLSDEEKKRLADVEGLWPDYPRTLVELADKYPARLLGPPKPPKSYQELPPEIRDALPPSFRKKPPAAIKAAEGKWPDYLIAVLDYAAKNKTKDGKELVLPPRLCPSRPEHFNKQIQQFIDKKLYAVLSASEKKQLNDALGKWPQYPRLILELARKHNLAVPGLTLPGPRGWWDNYRTSSLHELDAVPMLPDRLLKPFVLHELTREERARLRLSSADPFSRTRAEQEFARRKPDEWERQQRLDDARALRKFLAAASASGEE